MMIITLLAFHNLIKDQHVEKIACLPAPATMFAAIRHGDNERYRALVCKASEITKWYSLLNPTEQDRCLVRWYKSVLSLNQSLAKKYANVAVGVADEYSKQDEIDKGDFSKVDLLFMVTAKPTFFESGDWLKVLYNCRSKAGLVMTLPTDKDLFEVQKQVISVSSAGYHFEFYSFESRLKRQEEKFRDWMKQKM